MELHGLILLGSLRRDGSPRISPVEPLIVDGELELGMMWQSKKALDLLRDPRCHVHTVVTDRNGTEGEFKLWGRARDLELAERERYCVALAREDRMAAEGAVPLLRDRRRERGLPPVRRRGRQGLRAGVEGGRRDRRERARCHEA